MKHPVYKCAYSFIQEQVNKVQTFLYA